MSTIPENLMYAKTHEWVRIESDCAIVGITDHAQSELTDIVYVELPETGCSLTAGENCAVVESVKTASDIYSPVTGKVIEINTALEGAPELVNESAYKDGWFFKVELTSEPDISGLMDASAYGSKIAEN